MKRSLGLTIALTLPVIATAHHSRSHYPEVIEEITGELVAVHWVNPHVGFEIDVTDEAGQTNRWRIEGISNLGNMRRGGVSSDIFNIGEPVTFAGSVSIRRDNDMLASNMLLADGTEVLLGRGEPLRFTSGAVEHQPQATEASAVVDALAENLGIWRVWSNVPNGVGQRTDFQFSQAAVDARAEWNEVDNYTERCIDEGMPRIMRNPHPFEFIDREGEIEIVSELYDLTRIVYMNQNEPPTGTEPSLLGYSVGRWEGETLVVTTSHIGWPYFDNIGTPQSDDAWMVEEFTVSDDQARLDYRFTFNDPGYFSEPAVYERYWLALGDEIEVYDCQVFGESVSGIE
ncbi:MAG: DUF6152 family protein [Gammaproteobacteria bacterium]